MNPPTVSVLLPVYQGMQYLPQTLESFLSQAGDAVELIVGDDGSTDGSREWLAKVNHPKVSFFPSQKRLGLFGRLNALLPHCRGEWIRFLCQDDRLEPTALEQEREFAARHPSVAAVFSKYLSIGPEGEVLDRCTLGDLPEVLPSALAVQQLFYHGCIAGNLSAVSVRASVLRDLRGFDASYQVAGDYDLWARIAVRHPIGVTPFHALRVRNHRGQLSRARSSASVFVHENRRVRDGLFPHLPTQVRQQAKRYERLRHEVLAFHQGVRFFIAGELSAAGACFNALGAWPSLRAAFAWIWTLNNRRCPQAPWVMASA